jgi:hypothetical protein
VDASDERSDLVEGELVVSRGSEVGVGSGVLNIATGTVLTDIRSSHTSADFIAFLNQINRHVPKDLDVHVVLDVLAEYILAFPSGGCPLNPR